MDCQYSFVIMQQIICGFCGQSNENAFLSRPGNQMQGSRAVITKTRYHSQKICK